MKEETVWYGYLEAGQKSTPVVLDRRLHTGHDVPMEFAELMGIKHEDTAENEEWLDES